jgi:hypothetical protein
LTERLFDVPVVEEKAAEKRLKTRSEDAWIDDLVGALTDPIIVWPSPWMDTLPEKLKEQIPLQRLLMTAKIAHGELPTATDVEALAYMYPRTLEAPIGHDWTEIYLYLGTQVAKAAGKEVPEDIRKEELNKEQMRMLNELKSWIYDKRIKARKAKHRAAKQQAKEEKKQEIVVEQYKLFE